MAQSHVNNRISPRLPRDTGHDVVWARRRYSAIAVYRFTINGVSLLNYLAEDGIKWTRFDVEAPDTGRTLDGVMHRGRVASKVRLDITCRPLKSAEAMAVLSAIKPEFVTVRYIDPQDGSVTRTMYSNNIPTICATVNPDGTAIWKGLTFPLIER